SMFGVDDTERRLLAEIQGTPSDAPATTRDAEPPGASPKAHSPPPPRPASITDVSPVGPILPAPAPRLLVDDDATPAAPSVSAAPAPPVKVTSTLASSPVSTDAHK